MRLFARAAAFVLTILCLIGTPSAVLSAVLSPDIPAALEPWREWVLHDVPDRNCPGQFDDDAQRRCWWPTLLSVDAGDHGGLFDLEVTVYAPAWVSLPGDDNHWPESVVSGRDALPVVARSGKPAVWLDPGEYHLKGAFVWEGVPEQIQVPPVTGILSLTIDGREIADPDIDALGRLRLRGNGAGARSEDSMAVTVFRLIEDDIPMRVTTRLLLQVSGQPREVRLAGLLHNSATVMMIDSPLPVRLGDNGDVLVQVRPGQWDVRVTVRLDGPVDRLSMDSDLYGAETWSFKAFNHLRMVRLSGAPAIEPSRTRMPDSWKAFPAYRLEPGDALVFEQLRRGDPDPAADQLNLERTWWLDFDGSGFTIHDRINGALSRTWHLAMEPPIALGRVSVDGKDQLITLQGDRPSPGVQLRRGRLALEADSRLTRSSTVMPAVGWDHDFQGVHGVLNLPPGWSLFSANGVDIPSGAWLQRWSLLDFFLVLIIAVSAYKIRNRTAGLVALAALLLTYHEPGAPRYVWLHLLAVAALLQHLPRGWFKYLVKLWGAGAVVTLIAIAVPFTVQQIRSAVYPQLAPHGRDVRYRGAIQKSAEVAEDRLAALPQALSVAKSSTRPPVPDSRKRFSATDPNALIQTGPGLPEWHWRTIRLHWNGPVDRTQQLRLWLIPPYLNRTLGFLRIGLLAWMIALVLGPHDWRRHLPTTLSGSTSIWLIMLIVWATAQPLRAETTEQLFPPQAILNELRKRLLEPPPCLPHCAEVSRMELAATPDQLRLIMQVHASVDTAIPLPATLETWRPARILIDNQSAKSLARDERGALWLVLPQGVHQIKLIGPTGDANEIRIAFPIVPHVGTYAGVGWQAQGFATDGKMSAAIALTRVSGDRSASPEKPRSDIAPFFQVTRTLLLGIQWEVQTHIHRTTAPGKPAVLTIPLLEGASITTPGIQVQDGTARVSFGPEQTDAQFSASLPISPKLTLTAPRNVPWMETWVLDAATLWRCRTTGLTVIHHQDDENNWQPQWRPWPGEQVLIEVTRPAAVTGRTITVDNARLVLEPGRRFSHATLSLNLRSSKGGQHQIELPQSANLRSVAVNGRNLPIRQDGQLVIIPLEPGNQTATLQWRQLTGNMARVHAPQVNVGEAAVNASVTVQMPDNRWILFTGGPQLGPAVLFWSYLLVALLAAACLGRTTLTPLTARHWLLLALGLTQVPAVVAIVVVGWLLALGYRCKKAPRRAWIFDAVQLSLVVLTLAALAGLYLAIERGLLGIPDMQIAGNESTRYQLNWMQDRITGTMPGPWVVSLPLWIYHLLMLFWSLWLAFSLVAWLRWGWNCFTREDLWRPVQWRKKTKPLNAAQASDTSEGEAPMPDSALSPSPDPNE